MKTRAGRTAKRALAAKPKTPDDYLAAIDADQRAALETLRKNITAAAPKAEECISYGVPAFRLDGKFLVDRCLAEMRFQPEWRND